MKIKTVYNSIVPRIVRAEAITLYPFIFFAHEKESYINNNYYNKYSSIYRHELQHIYQVSKHGFFSFYISYAIFFIANIIRYKSWNTSYFMIPYEIEARKMEIKSLTEPQIKELSLD